MGIQVPTPRPKQSALEKIAQGINIAQGLLGIGLEIPKTISQYQQASEMEKLRKEQAVSNQLYRNYLEQKGINEYQLNLNKEFQPAKINQQEKVQDVGTPQNMGGLVDATYEPGAVPLGGQMMVKRPPTNQGSQWDYQVNGLNEAIKSGHPFVLTKDNHIKQMPMEMATKDSTNTILTPANYSIYHSGILPQEEKLLGDVFRQQSANLQNTKQDINAGSSITKALDDNKIIADKTKNIEDTKIALFDLDQKSTFGDKIAVADFARTMATSGRMTKAILGWISPNTLQEKANTVMTFFDNPTTVIPPNYRATMSDFGKAHIENNLIQRSLIVGQNLPRHLTGLPPEQKAEQKQVQMAYYGDWDKAKQVNDQYNKMVQMGNQPNLDSNDPAWLKERAKYNLLLNDFNNSFQR